MLDRVREALFSTLGGWLDGARVLDLYSGTGSMGLEAYSRGAEFVRFVERGNAARKALRANITALDAGDEVEVGTGSALEPVQWCPDDSKPGEPWADLILMDPPYPDAEHEPARSALLQALTELVETVLVSDGVLVLHTSPRALQEESFPAGWETKCRVYGRSALWYLQRDQGADPDSDEGEQEAGESELA